MKKHIFEYIEKLNKALLQPAVEYIPDLYLALQEAWLKKNTVYFCGNGGSAGNAIHLVNDLIYGAGIKNGIGIRAEALSANPAVITCLANDIGYDKIFSEQLRVKANSGDVLVVLSGSGNSPNIVNALKTGNQLGMKTFAILGFSGGLCKKIAQHPIHFEIDDMQIAEDLQLIIGHMCMQMLSQQSIHHADYANILSQPISTISE